MRPCLLALVLPALASPLAAQHLPCCDLPPLVVGRPATSEVVWPQRPDDPRVRWAGTVRSEADIGKKASGSSRLKQALTGSRTTMISLTRPHDVWVDGRNRLYVSDAGRRKLLRFDPASRVAVELGGEGLGRLNKPMGIAGTSDDVVFVADQSARRIVAFDASGAFVQAYGGEGMLLNPVDVAVDEEGQRVYVVDSYLHQVVGFDRRSGKVVVRLGKAVADAESARQANALPQRGHGDDDAASPNLPAFLRPDTAGQGILGHPMGYSPTPRDVVENRGSKAGEFRFPSFVATGPGGLVAVSDGLNFRVQLFDRAGKYLRSVGVQGDGPGQFARPKGVALDGEGRLYVADAAFSNVQVFDPRGRLLVAFGRMGNGDGELWMPEGLWADAAGRVYVSDRFNNRVQVYQHVGSRQVAGGEGGAR